MSKILLTGATGKTGMAALRELVSRGADICAMTRSLEKAKTFEDRGIDVVVADFNDINSLNNAMRDIDRLFLVSSPSPEMVQTEKNAINAAKKAGVQYIVKIAAIGAAKDAPYSLGQYHAMISEHLQKSGLAYTILHPHAFMQNLLSSRSTIREQQSIYANMGTAQVPMVDARDVGAVAAQLLLEGPTLHNRQTYTLTGPELLSYQDLAAILSEVLGTNTPIRYVSVSDETAHSNMLQIGMPEWLVNDLVALNRMWKNGQHLDVTHSVGELTGRPPRSFRTFVREHLAAFKG